MSNNTTNPGPFLAMLLGTKTDQQDKASNDQANTAGEDEYFIPTYAHSTDAFVEGPPTTAEWLRDQVPSPQAVHDYLYSLFPCLSWVGHYNTQWAAGDIVAGITIGAVVVPQSMAYALLANLEPQYGLYSSFIGVMIYWIFGTSKDISIGPVAVLSTVVGNIIDDVRMTRSDLPAHTIASAVSVIAGSVVLALGLLRFGYLIDLISITSLSAFMTGSAITIVVSQLPALLGASGFSNREAPYKVLLNTLAHLPGNNMDAAVGLSTLAMLYLIRHTFSWAAAKYPRRKRLLFFINTMRSVLIIVLYTCISFALNVSHKDNPVIKILGAVPRGFPRVILPDMDHDLASKIGHHLPATVIVMLVEHMAISKSFGRVNNYTIDPSQEMVAIGVTNILSPFFGGYSSTGSFSRTAIQSKAGVRTPAAGITAGVVVLLAMFLLTDVFFFIPTATLAAVIIHAVGDLLTSRDTIRQFWRVAPLEVLIFFVGVIVSIFGHIEDGLYATVCLSACVFLYRILKARGRFLGKVKVHSVLGDHIIGDHHRQVVGKYGTFQPSVDTTRNVFLPLDHGDGSNPEIAIFNPYPGIFIYRFSEGFNYPNANTALDFLTEFILGQTRRSRPEVYERKGDRPWNNPGLSMAAKSQEDASLQALPTLKAIILDFSAVNNVDITSVQRLIDVRNQLDTYVSPDVVDWHIACINNRWTKRALVAGGFGVPTKPRDGIYHRWKSIFSVAEIGGDDSAAALAEENANKELLLVSEEASDEERAGACQPVRSHNRRVESLPGSPRRGATVHSWDKPLFHVDLTSAVQSAIANAEARQELRAASRAQSIE